MQNKILLIAGLDPTGHAGLLRDIRVCTLLKQEYAALPTALTVQSDRKYFGTAAPDADYFANLWKCLDTKTIAAVKIGMLPSITVVDWVCEHLAKLKRTKKTLRIIWDPVFRSSSGGVFLNSNGINRAVSELLPLADIVTPNAVEACDIVGLKFRTDSEPERICIDFYQQHRKPVYLKGGHLKVKAIDFYYDGLVLKKFTGRKSSKKLRGTGCILSTAIACQLAGGIPLLEACRRGKKFINEIFSGNINI